MLGEIARFEVRYHTKQLVFYVCLVLFFLLAFGAVTSDSVQIGGSIGNVHRNAPFVIMQFLLVISVFSVFTTTAFVSNAALRDYDLGTAALFFSSPIRKRDYLVGRFAGSLLVSLLIYLGVVGGIMIGSFMPWLEKERLGPFTLAPYVYSLFVLIAPTVLLVAAIFFSLAVLTRSSVATYAGAVAFLVGYLVASAIVGDNLEYERIASLLDPFALNSFALSTRYWTVAERNTQVLPLQGVFLANRLLWSGVGAAIFAFTLWKFRFETVDKKAKKKKPASAGEDTRAPMMPIASPSTVDSRASSWLSQFASTTRLEIASTFKSVPFLVILILALVNTVAGAAFADTIADTTIYPVTGVMLRVIQGNFLLFAIIIMTFYAGEIVFRERQSKLNEVTDAMPVSSSAVWGGKLAALYLLVVILLTAAMLATIIVQTAKGYTNYELDLYAKGLYLDVLVPMLMMATLAFVFQVALNNKYAGFLGMVLFIVSLPVLPALDLEHNLYRFASRPPSPYSDMNGYGHFVAPMTWFMTYWGLFCALLILGAHLFWVRGTESAIRTRTRIAAQRFGKGAKLACAGLVVAFIATGAFIYYNTNILNLYRTTDDGEKAQAEYEKNYKKYDALALPNITDVKADVDIYPERRAVSIRGTYTLKNNTAAPIRELHVTMNPEVTRWSATLPGAKVRMADKRRGYTIYDLQRPLAPGETAVMSYEVAVEPRGFVNSGANTDLVHNGSFINNFFYFPRLGYQSGLQLEDRNTRRKYGLGPAERYPSINDARARNINQLTAESHWLNLDTTVSTSADQIAIAPGYLQKEWTANGRRYFQYKTTSPILGFWSYLSARYAVKRDKWNDVAIEIYYHPEHAYNVDRMIEGVKKSLDYFSANFSPYQHKQVRILEFPRYQRFAQSFPNTIPFSESIGFIADLRDKEDIDYVFYITAHEVAHQWWAHQVIGARVQGTTMITETLAQYSALMVMEKEFGRAKMQKYLRHELNAYLAGRGGELIAEMPLKLVEDQPYVHYRKGSLAMYALRDAIGEDNVNAALREVIAKWAFQGPPYVRTVDLLDAFRRHTPPEQQSLIEDLFETITLYDNKATAASSVKTADGKYRVTLTVEAKKLRADGEGNEKPVAINDWVDVGLLGPKDDEVLLIEKRRITQPKSTFELVVAKPPARAGIDPLNKLIDRNPTDNIRKVE
jgi:ABC-2 type transport system permease protein